ncbi:hypothetical protein HMPREF1254_0013 [Prevotella sp. BV3P1]|nr:hypothetical protein HMPREF1254_0013 [Prevotella sp. BV3P1]
MNDTRIARRIYKVIFLIKVCKKPAWSRHKMTQGISCTATSVF